MKAEEIILGILKRLLIVSNRAVAAALPQIAMPFSVAELRPDAERNAALMKLPMLTAIVTKGIW